MLVDQARIYVKSGDGGNGAMSFHREKFVQRGGPDGGDGGRGGDVKFRAKANLTSLIAFRFASHFKARSGEQGTGRNCSGKSAKTLYVDVPVGTIIYHDETAEMLADLAEDGAEYRVARGGKGGLGNQHFKSSIHRSPRIAEFGEPGEEAWVKLELRLIADVGLVGLPNAGKSTLLAASSAAKPKIADYPFTTLQPNLGVVELGGVGGQTYVMADVPGLIEGAAGGHGLGHEFLRHVTRTKMLVHVLDASGGLEERDPIADFETINQELGEYDASLLERPMIIVLNKIDIPEARDNLKRLRTHMAKKKLPVFELSAATQAGVPELLNEIGSVLREIAARPPVEETVEFKTVTLENNDPRSYKVRRTGMNEFEVTGVLIERTTRMTNFDFMDASDRFQKILKSTGILAELTKMGIEIGDMVRIADRELIWGDLEDLEPPTTKRRTARERYLNRKSREAT